MPVIRLLYFLFLVQLSTQVYVKSTCTSSHIWLEPSDDQWELVPLDKPTCSSSYRNQTTIDRYCMGSQRNMRVALSPRKWKSSRNDAFIVSCPDTTADEILDPISAVLKAYDDHVIEITVQEQQKLILSSKLTVVDCFLFSVDHPSLQYQLIDNRGCPNDELVSTVEEVAFGTRRRYRARLVSSVPLPFVSPQLQCSLVLCGAECTVPCREGRAEWTPSSTKILLSTSLPPSYGPAKLQKGDCSWWLQRFLLLLLIAVLLCSTVFLVYASYRNCPWTLQEIREVFRLERPRRRGLLHIVHPIDHFDSPPVITKRIASLKIKPVEDSASSLASISTETSKKATIQSSIQNFDEYLTSGFMENLPEPPNVPISKLADIVGKGKTAEKEKEIIYANIKKLKAPTPLQRTVSKTIENETVSTALTTANLQRHDEIQTAIMMTFKTFDTPILGKTTSRAGSVLPGEDEETTC